MSYSENIAAIARQALAQIKEALDKTPEIVLWTPNDEQEDSDDLFLDLPGQMFYGKYGNYDEYKLFRLYKEGDEYYGEGSDRETEQNYHFTLAELDSSVLAELGDEITFKQQS